MVIVHIISAVKVLEPLDVVHSDVWGPTASCNGYIYYVIFIDDYSKFTSLFPLINKSQVFDCFVKFHLQFSKKLKILRSDNGGEFIDNNFRSYCDKFGIVHQTTCPHTAEQNGVSEQKHRHLIETTCTVLLHSSMPLKSWVEALTTATYLINRLSTPTLNNLSPFEKLFHTPPDYNALKTFRCLCFPWLKPYVNSKLAPKSNPCCFIGYCLNTKGYRCLDISIGRIYISRHISFVETEFPFSRAISHMPSPSTKQPVNYFSLTTPFHQLIINFPLPPPLVVVRQNLCQILILHTPLVHYLPLPPHLHLLFHHPP